MRRAILSAVLVIAAVMIQLTLVNRLALASSGPPDVVLLVVIGLAMSGGPAAGTLTGFLAGLCLDLAPPGSPLIGEYALVLCVIGYGCGLLRGVLGRPVRVSPVALASGIIAAAAGEALAAGLSLALSPGQASLPVVRQVLPATIFADAALSLVVLPVVLLLGRLADGPAPVPEAAKPAPSAIREQQARKAARRLRAGGAGLLGDGWIGRAERARRAPASRAPAGAPWLRAASARRRTARPPGSGAAGRPEVTAPAPAAARRRPPSRRPGAGPPSGKPLRPAPDPVYRAPPPRAGRRRDSQARDGPVAGAPVRRGSAAARPACSGRAVQGRAVQGRAVQGRRVQGRSVRGRTAPGSGPGPAAGRLPWWLCAAPDRRGRVGARRLRGLRAGAPDAAGPGRRGARPVAAARPGRLRSRPRTAEARAGVRPGWLGWPGGTAVPPPAARRDRRGARPRSRPAALPAGRGRPAPRQPQAAAAPLGRPAAPGPGQRMDQRMAGRRGPR